MIFASLRKAEDDRIDYNDLLRFINVKIDPLPPAEPVNVKVGWVMIHISTEKSYIALTALI